MKNAVIIGGGIAGLSAAQVLSKYFAQVTIYDGADARQSLHLHVLLKTGQITLEKIFPGISQDFIAETCPHIDWALDTVWENSGGAFPRYASDMKTLSMSREILQEKMKSRLAKNIGFINEQVLDLNSIKASLVVVAGGNHFPLKRFFGKCVKESDPIHINLTYRSYIFQQSELNMPGFKQYYFQVDPPLTTIGGVICPIENGMAMVTIISQEKYFSQCTNLEDFLLKAKQISGGTFYNIIKDATPLTKLATFRKLTTQRKTIIHSKLPKGIIMMGDVVTSLNPIFGQGMSIALKQAELLDSMLQDKTFTEIEFHKRCAQLGKTPYFLSSIGSQENSLGKKILRLYLKICQQRKSIHHFFIHQLHSLHLIPPRLK